MGAISQLSFLQIINSPLVRTCFAVEPFRIEKLCKARVSGKGDWFNEGFIHKKLVSAFLNIIGIDWNTC